MTSAGAAFCKTPTPPAAQNTAARPAAVAVSPLRVSMKVVFVLILAIAVFGAGGYYTYKLFVKPQQELLADKALPPLPPPPDPSLPDFDRCVQLQQSADLIGARSAFADFIERNPDSTKLGDARERLGVINSYILLSNYPAPEKESYVVQKGDVISRVAVKMRSTPELILKANDLHGVMLRIGQRLTVAPADFSLVIDRKDQKVVVLDKAKFFKQYRFAIAAPEKSHPLTAPTRKAAPAPHPPKIAARVTEVISLFNGQRVTPFDKDKGQAYAEADRWIEIAPAGHSLYTDRSSDAGKPTNKPPGGGYGLPPDAMDELAAMLHKSTTVVIE